MRHETLQAVLHPNISLRIMERFLLSEGFDPSPAFEAADVRREDWRGTWPAVSGVQELAFQEALVRITGHRPRLWVRLGRCYRATSYGPLSLAMLTAPSLRAVLEFQMISTFGYSLMRVSPVQVDDHTIGMELEYESVPDGLHEFLLCRSLGAGTQLLHDLWGRRFPISLISSEIDVPAEGLGGILGVPVRSRADRTVWFWPAQLSDQRLVHADPLLHEVYTAELKRELCRHAAPVSFLSRVEKAVRSMSDPRMGISYAAEALGMTPRTLQRRMREQNTSYRAMVDMVRRRRAIHLLSSTGFSISEIAERLGYSELTSFDHAFHRWTGFSPSDFRESRSGTGDTPPPNGGE